MTTTTLATILTLTGILLVRKFVRSQLRPLLRRAR